MTWENDFTALGDEYYPGSSKKIKKTEPPPQPPPAESWDAHPRRYQVGPDEYEFFTIGDLAAALHRATVTIRHWEDAGILPVVPELRSPSTHPGKRHRIYSRPLVEGIVRIATEEGLLYPYSGRRKIADTGFKQKIHVLFRELSLSPLYGAVPSKVEK